MWSVFAGRGGQSVKMGGWSGEYWKSWGFGRAAPGRNTVMVGCHRFLISEGCDDMPVGSTTRTHSLRWDSPFRSLWRPTSLSPKMQHVPSNSYMQWTGTFNFPFHSIVVFSFWQQQLSFFVQLVRNTFDHLDTAIIVMWGEHIPDLPIICSVHSPVARERRSSRKRDLHCLNCCSWTRTNKKKLPFCHSTDLVAQKKVPFYG
jgi:hypothetical protein